MRIQLHWQIGIAIVLAVLAGLASGTEGAIFGLRWYDVYAFFGAAFLNALKMLIVPIITSSIIAGVASIGTSGTIGKLGGKTFLYYMATSLLAILTGLLLVNLVTPGLVDGQPAKALIGLGEDTAAVAAAVEGRGAGDLVQVFLRMIPPNIVAAAAEGQMLGLITFSLLFGYFMTRIPRAHGDTLLRFWQAVADVMMRIAGLVMRFAPIGVFGLVAKIIAATGLGIFRPLAAFFFTVLAALAVHACITLPLLLRILAKRSPQRHVRAMAPALLTAFSTSSSAATLPVTMECVQDRARVSKRVSSFVLPLGATINMDGTALYECVAAMFIAQAYGLQLGFTAQFTVVWIALLTSIGVAGIPAASLVAIAIILGAIGLPVEAIGLILAVDRILDMCRTSVNVFSDSCGAVIIGRSEGEHDILAGSSPRT